jgi:hypothetical protein
VHTFTDSGLAETTLITPGDQILNVMDTADNTISGSALVTVGSPAPAPAAHGPEAASQPGRSQASTPPSRRSAPSAPPRPAAPVAADWWFASVREEDAAFAWSLALRHAHAGGSRGTPDRW